MKFPSPSHRPPTPLARVSLSALVATLFLGVSMTDLRAEKHKKAPEPAPVGVGVLYETPTKVDEGGEVSRFLFRLTGGVPLYSDERTRSFLSVDYRFWGFDFDNVTGARGRTIEWDDVHELTLALPMVTERDRWFYVANPSLQFAGESDADFGETISGGLIEK